MDASPWGGDTATTMLERIEDTKRRIEQTKREALANEERFFLAVEGANDGLWDLHFPSNSLYLSPRWKNMLGHEDDEIPNERGQWRQRIHPDDLERADAVFQAHLDGETDTYQLEHRLRHKDGSYRWILARGASIRDANGNIVRMAGWHTDITAQKQAEETLRRSEATNRALLNAIPDLMLRFDKRGTYLDLHAQGASELIVDPGTKIGRTLDDVVPPNGARALKEGIARTLESRTIQVVEYSLVIRGVPHEFEARMVPISDGVAEDEVLAIVRDVTERKRAEETLRQSEATNRALLDAIPDLMLRFDKHGTFLDLHAEGTTKLIVDPSTGVGRTVDEVIPGDAARLIKTGIERTLATGTTQTVEYGILFSTGPREFEARMAPIPDGVAEDEVLAIVRDVTERKRAEETLRRSEETNRALLNAIPDLLFRFDRSGTFLDAAAGTAAGLGPPPKDLLGQTLADALPPDIAQWMMDSLKRTLETRTPQVVEFRLTIHGEPCDFESRTVAIGDETDEVLTLVRDITERKRIDEELRARERQQAVVADLGQRALASTDLAALFAEGATVIAETLGVDFSIVMELLPDGRHFRRCAGIGWREGIIGDTPVLADPDSNAAYTVRSGAPVIFEDLSTETRFRGIPVLRDHGVVSGMSVIIPGPGRPFGVLGAHMSTRRAFTDDDINFLQAVANVIAAAIQRERDEEQLREKEAQYRGIFESASDGLCLNEPDTGVVVEANPAFCEMHGYTHEEMIGIHPTAFIHPDFHGLLSEYIRTAGAGGSFQGQAVDVRKDGTPLHVEIHGSAFTYQGKPHLLASVRDISERVQAYHLLEQRVAERTRELSTLLDVSHNVSSTLELQPLLGLIFDQIELVAAYTAASVLLLDGDELVIVASRLAADPTVDRGAVGLRFQSESNGEIWEAISGRQPIIVPDVDADTPMAQAYRAAVGPHRETTFRTTRSWLAIPLAIKERVIGMLILTEERPNFFTPHQAELALAIANQAAVAIENARLHEQARSLAALEERQRLARELHDSVSQALYGISLGARTARTLLDRDPSRVAEPLEYVLGLAEAGLAEMRALIFELRPESLETEGLVAALGKQAASLRARHGITVETRLGIEPRATIEVKEALYRIAQEALNNTIKHARARTVWLRLDCNGAGVSLEIADDGSGFDPSGAFPGHLGLRSMRERAARLGGTVTVESAPGQGTRIRASMPPHEDGGCGDDDGG